MNFITFAVSHIGASHIVKGLPCQDYSLSYESPEKDIQIIVVCDGHGSDAHCRSDVGAKFAATSAQKKLLKFANEPKSVKFFSGKSGSGTSITEDEDYLWGSPKDENELTEMERLRQEQSAEYQEQIADHSKIEDVVRKFCTFIMDDWKNSIQEHLRENPFSEREKELLGDNPPEKAYGTTLMAFLRTPSYWLALHIGDGRILYIDHDKSGEWKPLVPWDVKCFQNQTTSLCASNAVDCFRYAFGKSDGDKGSPAIVFGCSDGIEDSFGDYEVCPEYLHDFYFKLLKMLMEDGIDSSIEKMREGFAKLSERGSKDDMSLAGFVDLDAVPDLLKKWEKRKSRKQG